MLSSACCTLSVNISARIVLRKSIALGVYLRTWPKFFFKQRQSTIVFGLMYISDAAAAAATFLPGPALPGRGHAYCSNWLAESAWRP